MREYQQLPEQYSLTSIFSTEVIGAEVEMAVCYTSLFVVVVQDRCELGGGYGLQIIALDTLINKHFDEIEQVEDYLAEAIPYKKHAEVWVPLPNYHIPGKSGSEYLKRLLVREK